MSLNQIIKQIWLVLVYFYDRLVSEGCTYRAASLAYTTLLSIVPIMFVTGTIMSFFPTLQGEAQHIQRIILQNFVAESTMAISQHLDDFAKNISQLSIMNAFFLVFVGILLIHNMNSAFTSIWRATQPLWFSVRILIYLVVLVLSPILLASMLFFSTSLIKLTFLADLLEKTDIRKILFVSLPYLIVFVTFTLLNWVLPSCKVRLKYAVFGGLISTILFEIAKYIFVLYIRAIPTYRLLYGALSTIPIFLVWLYVAWVIVLLGVIVSHTIATGLPEIYRVQKK
jgi:membrane protein